MRKTYTTLILILVLTIFGCYQDDDPQETEKDHVLVWKVPSGENPDGTMPLVLENGTIIQNGAYLEKRSLDDGSLIWQAPLNEGYWRSRNMLLIENTVIVYAFSCLIGVEVETGETLFRIQVEGHQITGTQSISIMNNTVYIGGINTIAIVDIQNQTYLIKDLNDFFGDGQRRYVHEVAVDPDVNRVFLPLEYWDNDEGLGYGQVLCMDPMLNEIIWQRDESNEITFPDGNTYTYSNGCFSGFVSSDVLYYVSQFYMYAVNTDDGSLIWSTLNEGGVFCTPPALYNNSIYVGEQSSGGIKCMNAETGVQCWRTDVNYTVSTLFSFYDNEIYVCSVFSNIIDIFNTESGELTWSSHQKDDVENNILTPVGVGYGYSVVVGANYIYCHKVVEL